MDRDGIAAEIIYASIGMGLCMHHDSEYKDACMKAYNRWLQGMCSEAPNRVFGLAQTATLWIARLRISGVPKRWGWSA
jgi:uncharacterized protein